MTALRVFAPAWPPQPTRRVRRLESICGEFSPAFRWLILVTATYVPEQSMSGKSKKCEDQDSLGCFRLPKRSDRDEGSATANRQVTKSRL